MNPGKKFPSEFINRISSRLGNEADDFFSSLFQPPFLSVRINPFKPVDKFGHCETVPWCDKGRYLSSRPSFIFDPLFHAGTYYVQEPSSMFLSEIFRQVIDPRQKLKLLDLCASPGGKSTLMSGHISPESLLVSNETIRSRVPALCENLVKWGVPNTIISNSDPEKFLSVKNYFDVIVIDAPCSGEGLFRKEEKAISEWSESNVKLCSARQKRILSGVFDSLKQNGILVYSTCTFSEEENEDNVKFIAGQGNFETVKINLKEEWKITGTVVSAADQKYYSYRFYPHRVKGEGFFISAFRKNTGTEDLSPEFSHHEKRYPVPKITKEELCIISPWLKNPSLFEFVHWRNEVYALLKEHWNDYLFLSGRINCYSAGTCIGKIIHDELIPSHELALSLILSENIQSVELDEKQAIKYLKREPITINSELKGWTLVRFEGYSLGWVKILSNRVNNYFPKEYRILKT